MDQEALGDGDRDGDADWEAPLDHDAEADTEMVADGVLDVETEAVDDPVREEDLVGEMEAVGVVVEVTEMVMDLLAPVDHDAEGVVEAKTSDGCATGLGKADGVGDALHTEAQSMLPRALNLPAGHAKQAAADVEPGAGLNVLGSHGSQSAEAARLYVPGPH